MTARISEDMDNSIGFNRVTMPFKNNTMALSSPVDYQDGIEFASYDHELPEQVIYEAAGRISRAHS